MKITFYLLDEDQTEITSFNKIEANPFKIGDVISVLIRDLQNIQQFPLDLQKEFLSKNKEMVKKVSLKKIKINEEFKYIDFNILREPTLVIEYFCEVIEE